MLRPLVRYTIDASVFVNAFMPHELGHEASSAFLRHVRGERITTIVPTLALAEVAATVARIRNDAPGARAFAELIARLPDLALVALGVPLMWESVDVAARYRLRGSDAVYAAVALKHGAVLVTRDSEMRQRLVGIVTVHTPEEALALL